MGCRNEMTLLELILHLVIFYLFQTDVTCDEFGTETNPLSSGVVMQKEGHDPIYDSRRIFTCESETARFSDGMIRKEAICSSSGQWTLEPGSCQGIYSRIISGRVCRKVY